MTVLRHLSAGEGEGGAETLASQPAAARVAGRRGVAHGQVYLSAGEEDDGGGDGDEHDPGKVVKHVLALGVCHAL